MAASPKKFYSIDHWLKISRPPPQIDDVVNLPLLCTRNLKTSWRVHFARAASLSSSSATASVVHLDFNTKRCTEYELHLNLGVGAANRLFQKWAINSLFFVYFRLVKNRLFQKLAINSLFFIFGLWATSYFNSGLSSAYF